MNSPIDVKQVLWSSAKEPLRTIRTAVFIEEQKVPVELEWDEHDEHCIHVLATVNGLPAGTGRMLANGHIGRMAVLPAFRGQGVGSLILSKLLLIAREQNLESVFLHAQTSAIGFYRKHGFLAYGNEFMDAGIPHLSMNLKLSNGN